MKKALILCLALLVLLPVLGSCGNKKTTDSPLSSDPESIGSLTEGSSPSTSEDAPQIPTPSPADGVLACTKDGKALKVTITLESDKKRTVSLLLLDDATYAASWAQHPEHLIDLDEVTLDDQGQGTLTLHLKDEAAPCHLILTAESGNYSLKVNG